jgi:Carboxypeptidase regulatory-like domain
MRKRLPMSGFNVSDRDAGPTGGMAVWRSGAGRWVLAVLVGCVGLLAAAPVAAAAGTGAISGKVTHEVTPLKGIQVQVFTASRKFVGAATTDSSGEYKVTELAPGSYRVEFVDFSNTYAPQYYKGAHSFATATAVPVEEEKTTPEINAELLQGGKISGTVTNILGNPLANISVFVTSEEFFGVAQTEEKGEYKVTGLPKGSYKVQFLPGFELNFVPQYYNGASSPLEATSGEVKEEETEKTIELSTAKLQEGGKISGTVTDAATHAPLAHACVSATNALGFEFFGGFAETNANGEYTIVGLGNGSYNLEFESCSEQEGATEYITQSDNGVAVTQGSTKPGVNVALVRKAPVNTVAPVASGTPAVGQTLSCSNGSWTGSGTLKFTYAWLRDGSAIAGASGSTYVVQAADQGHGLACQVTATNAVSHAAASSNTLKVPSAPSPAPPSPPPPTVSLASESASTWREGNKLATFSRKKPPIGTSFSFILNEQANVSFAFTQQLSGRELKGKCVAQTRKNRHKPACKRAVSAGALSFTGHGGVNRVVFQGRISSSKRLGLGSYTLLITAKNGSGQSSARPLRFSIVK